MAVRWFGEVGKHYLINGSYTTEYLRVALSSSPR